MRGNDGVAIHRDGQHSEAGRAMCGILNLTDFDFSQRSRGQQHDGQEQCEKLFHRSQPLFCETWQNFYQQHYYTRSNAGLSRQTCQKNSKIVA